MKTALLIIEVQTALCTGQWAAFDIEKIVGRINAISRRARAAGVPVVLIQHEDEEGPLRFGTDGWTLFQELTAQPEDIRIRKTGSDAFHRTELHSLLQAQEVDKLVVCGLQPIVKEIFEISRFNIVFHVLPDRTAALAEFRVASPAGA